MVFLLLQIFNLVYLVCMDYRIQMNYIFTARMFCKV
uniref:Uncharacterized protein n=1 Tax=Anguilla anguilla TaxID=7936 RepID=A0A0E9SKN5_ANGAN